MVRDRDVSQRVLDAVRQQYPEAKPIEVVFYDPASGKYIGAYEGAEGKIRTREVELKTF